MASFIKKEKQMECQIRKTGYPEITQTSTTRNGARHQSHIQPPWGLNQIEVLTE